MITTNTETETALIAALLLASCTPMPPKTPLTFLALNVANGCSDAYRTPAARATQSALILSSKADVVCLQEVDRGTERVGLIDTDREITPPGALVRAVEQPTGAGTTGNSLWVRDDARVVEEWEIGHDYSAWDRGSLVSDTAPRRSACARIEFEDKRQVSACCVHLTSSATHLDGSPAPADAIRERQIAQVAGFDPDVIMGDFNALDYELAPQMMRLGYVAATRGELVAVWWRLSGKGRMIPAGGASDHPGAAEAITE